MARSLRIEYPGAVYHVTSRGNGREAIFLSDEDRWLFLAVLAQVVDRLGWFCHAFSLIQHERAGSDRSHGGVAMMPNLSGEKGMARWQ